MFQRLYLAVLIGAALGLPAAGARAQSIAYGTRSAAGVTANVITVNMSDPAVKVSVVLAQGFPGTDEAFTSLVKRSGAVAAIDGTFFDKYSRIPIGDIVVDGRARHEGRMGTAMAITPDNKVAFGRVVWGYTADWSGYETVLACGPTVVKNGQVDLKVPQERFRDPHVLGAAVRTAVGLTANNRLLLVTITRGVTLAKLAQVMKALGCVDAMNLDGGASMAMYYRGKVVVPAGRRLTNLLVVHEKAKHIAVLESPRMKPEGNGGQPQAWASREGVPAAGMAPEGAPVYPGAQAKTLSGWADAPPLFSTPDALAKVVAFYRSELGERARIREVGEGDEKAALITIESGPGAGALVQAVRRGGITMVVINPKGYAVPGHFFRGEAAEAR